MMADESGAWDEVRQNRNEHDQVNMVVYFEKKGRKMQSLENCWVWIQLVW